jgi:DNA segregation ATPase FtsK/SpoIIIE-like protein
MTDYTATIESVFTQFGIEAVVAGTTVGPSVTRYEVMLGDGVKVEKVASLQKQFAYATGEECVRVIAPIPGKSAVGIELPNDTRETVELFEPSDNHPLTIAVGKTVDGELLSINLGQMPHLLVAGTTGSGKSTFINAMLVSLLKHATPKQVQLVLVDPKMVELTPYEGVEHLLRPVVTEVDEAIEALNSLVEEMEERYQVMREAGVRHIDGLGYPYIVCVIDELADLMMAATSKVEGPIVRLAQKARAAGIHLVLATQRPSVDVVTGLIKANIPSRLAFAVRSHVDSRVILDEGGADQLLGMGDGLLLPVGARNVIRVQGVYVPDRVIARAVRAASVVTHVSEPPRLNPRPSTPEPQSVVLDELINYGKAAVDKINRFLATASGSRLKHEDAMMAFCDAPLELSRSALAMENLIHGIEMVREGGRPNVANFYTPGAA